MIVARPGGKRRFFFSSNPILLTLFCLCVHHVLIFPHSSSALVQDSPRTATVTALTRSVVLSITQQNFQRFFEEAPEAIADFEVKLARYDVRLRSVLYHPVGLQFFQEHLKREYSEENLDFWVSARCSPRLVAPALLRRCATTNGRLDWRERLCQRLGWGRSICSLSVCLLLVHAPAVRCWPRTFSGVFRKSAATSAT